jgi:hypothetical protein
MKRLLTSTAVALCSVFLLTGCIGLALGAGDRTTNVQPTVGQQLVDLKKARDAGAISEAEYQHQRAKLLGK